MNLSYAQMNAVVKEITPLLVGKVIVRIMGAGSRKFILDFQKFQLLFSFQEPFLRFHLTHKKAREENHPFINTLHHYLEDSELQSIRLLNHDRILLLVFKKNGKKFELLSEFFPRGPQCFLLDENREILATLNPSELKKYALPPTQAKPESESVEIKSADLEKLFDEREKVAEFESKKAATQRELNKRLKRALGGIEKAKQQLAFCLEGPKLSHEAELLQSNMYRWKKGMTTLTVTDWEKDNREVMISLSPELEPQVELKMRFKQARKRKEGVPYAEKYLATVNQEWEEVRRGLKELATISSLEELDHFRTKFKIFDQAAPTAKIKAEEKRALPYREFHSASGLKIWVGKGAAENEKLTFSYAHGSDWWFHVEHLPGSHVVIHLPKNQEPDPESIKDAAQLALYYSKAKERGEAEVCMTQCKFVSKFGKGKVGKVQLSKYKTLFIKQDPERFQRLKKA
jgi:predicted ribosome quality control (RQC) complex YloA/Tae2 family protein